MTRPLLAPIPDPLPDGVGCLVHHSIGGVVTTIAFPPSADPFQVLARVERLYQPKSKPEAGSPPVLPPKRVGAQIPASGGDDAHPAGKRTNPERGARALAPAREAARTPSLLAGAVPEPRKGHGGEGSGGLVDTASRGQGGPDAATPSASRAGVRDTSMKAYRALTWSGKMGEQQRTILDVFLRDPTRTWTRQELAKETGLGINAVCGRVNELLDEPFNLLVERGRKTCAVTNNEVNAIALATNEESPS